mmetsp:Transcript_6176/g.11427  ORF Transcript_6176/g.11427 Transcript_6176/m.11427 type:complete len:248 (-) Transcript_6176:568-1311(-)
MMLPTTYSYLFLLPQIFLPSSQRLHKRIAVILRTKNTGAVRSGHRLWHQCAWPGLRHSIGDSYRRRTVLSKHNMRAFPPTKIERLVPRLLNDVLVHLHPVIAVPLVAVLGVVVIAERCVPAPSVKHHVENTGFVNPEHGILTDHALVGHNIREVWHISPVVEDVLPVGMRVHSDLGPRDAQDRLVLGDGAGEIRVDVSWTRDQNRLRPRTAGLLRITHACRQRLGGAEGALLVIGTGRVARSVEAET